MATLQKIVPNLWFNGNAKEAVDYYVSVFDDGEILETQHYPETEADGLADFQKDMAGKVLVVAFSIGGLRFTAINADDTFTLSPAVSFVINCADQAEIDYYWDKLSAVPEAEQCGWCQDKFGLSWQVVPENMNELVSRPNGYVKMMDMHKIEVDKF